MCAFASYYTNLGSAEVDKINRDEHFHRAESLLNQASLIRRNGAPGEKEEQLPVLGMAHLKMARGDTAEAEKLLDAARNLKDDGAENIAPMLWKALFLFRRDQFGDALQWYRRALRAHPGAPASVRLGIGACQLRLGQFAQALKAFERALSLEPQNPDALLGAALAELHGASPSSAGDLEAGDGASSGAYDAGIERGLQYLERAFNVDPHNPATRVALAKHFLVADAPSGDAVRLLTETVAAPGAGGGAGATDRLRAEAAYTRARAAHRSGDLAGARSLYQAAAQLDETFAAPAFGLAQVALARGDRKAAGVYADQARAAFPESHPVVRVYGHLRRAEDAARSAAAGGGMVSVGKAGAGAGRDAETAAALRRAADADASDFAARLELGDALLGAGEYAEASAAYERAAEIAPGGAPSAALLNNCGVLRAMTGRGAHEGRFEKARGWFLRALAAAHAESDDSGEKKTGEALDVSAVRVKTPEAALPVAFNLARLVEDRGMVADAERRYRDLLVASPKMTECLLRLASMRAERRDRRGDGAGARGAGGGRGGHRRDGVPRAPADEAGPVGGRAGAVQAAARGAQAAGRAGGAARGGGGQGPQGGDARHGRVRDDLGGQRGVLPGDAGAERGQPQPRRVGREVLQGGEGTPGVRRDDVHQGAAEERVQPVRRQRAGHPARREGQDRGGQGDVPDGG